jgi:hypothetical protein
MPTAGKPWLIPRENLVGRHKICRRAMSVRVSFGLCGVGHLATNQAVHLPGLGIGWNVRERADLRNETKAHSAML